MMKLDDFSEILASLSKQRPVFHSEADFQHSLAWHMHDKFPNFHFRLEYPISSSSRKDCDIAILQGGKVVLAIELKYIRQTFRGPVGGEYFRLRWHAAADVGCHGVLKDVERLEEFLERNSLAQAHVIALTNDPIIWEGPRNWGVAGKRQVNYASFVLKDHRVGVTNTLDWAPEAAPKIQRAYKRITLRGKYTIKWQEYSNLELHGVKDKFTRFRFLHIPVSGE